jgi:hypothetical protein
MKDLLPLVCSVACISWMVILPIGNAIDGLVICALYFAGVFSGINSLYRL